MPNSVGAADLGYAVREITCAGDLELAAGFASRGIGVGQVRGEIWRQHRRCGARAGEQVQCDAGRGRTHDEQRPAVECGPALVREIQEASLLSMHSQLVSES